MLARLDQIDGVESSFVNESGTVLRLSLRPGADPKKVAESARRVVSKQVEDRVPVRLGSREAVAALQGQEWRDKRRVAEVAETEMATAEMPTSARRAPAVLAALLLGCTAVGLGLLSWRHFKRPGKI